ncbi:MAG: response regulator, partial [Armatimonadota bacterium]
VIGDRQIAYVRLKEVEDALKAKTEQLETLNRELERKVAERTKVAENRAALLQSMASDLLNAEQRERRRLGRLLHDHLQQLLTAGQMRAHLLCEQIADDDASTMLNELTGLLSEAVDASRSLAVELSPPVLTHGLAAATEWLADHMRDTHKLQVTVEVEGDVEPESEELSAFLLQAMRELLFNVVKHAGVDSAALRVCRADDRILIEVQDEGCGFDPAKLTDPRESSQAGSGLPGIRRRLELLGGSLEVESSPGQGAAFRLGLQTTRMPAAETERPVVKQTSLRLSSEEAGGEPRVLIVDDHDIVREGLVALISDCSEMTVVGEACDGETAVSMAADLRPNVIVMDVSMPGMDGIEATRRIVAQQPDVRIVGLSMHAERDVARQMREAGADSYVTKGGPNSDLIAAIRGEAGPSDER